MSVSIGIDPLALCITSSGRLLPLRVPGVLSTWEKRKNDLKLNAPASLLSCCQRLQELSSHQEKKDASLPVKKAHYNCWKCNWKGKNPCPSQSFSRVCIISSHSSNKKT